MALLAETISAMQWGSAAIAVVGAAASIAGLLRYFALQASTDAQSSTADDGWAPVLGGDGD